MSTCSLNTSDELTVKAALAFRSGITSTELKQRFWLISFLWQRYDYYILCEKTSNFEVYPNRIVWKFVYLQKILAIMKEPEVSKADVSTELELPMYESIAAGFPITSDYVAERLDFNRDFIKHPESTFYVRVKGDSMKDAGIFDGDLCVVDKAEELSHGNIVAAYYNNGFTVKYLDTSTKDQGFIRLVPANKDFKPFIVDASDEFTVWGKVIFTIRDWRNSYCLP